MKSAIVVFPGSNCEIDLKSAVEKTSYKKTELLWHKENGFYENKWTWTNTRKNQLHFYNKVLKEKSGYKRDGIDNVRYDLLSDTEMKDYHFISVEL